MQTMDAVGSNSRLQSQAAHGAAQQHAAPLLLFQLHKRYGGLYTNRHERFVLREEHISELKRLVREHNAERKGLAEPLSMSDIINGALDFAFEHPMAFHSRVDPERLAESLGREVYRKALVHLVRHEII